MSMRDKVLLQSVEIGEKQPEKYTYWMNEQQVLSVSNAIIVRYRWRSQFHSIVGENFH